MAWAIHTVVSEADGAGGGIKFDRSARTRLNPERMLATATLSAALRPNKIPAHKTTTILPLKAAARTPPLAIDTISKINHKPAISSRLAQRIYPRRIKYNNPNSKGY